MAGSSPDINKAQISSLLHGLKVDFIAESNLNKLAINLTKTVGGGDRFEIPYGEDDNIRRVVALNPINPRGLRRLISFRTGLERELSVRVDKRPDESKPWVEVTRIFGLELKGVEGSLVGDGIEFIGKDGRRVEISQNNPGVTVNMGRR